MKTIKIFLFLILISLRHGFIGEWLVNKIMPCSCDLNYNPVCGLSGLTRTNQCILKCKGDEKLYEGECEEEKTKKMKGILEKCKSCKK